MSAQTKESGFTLIELLVLVVIAGVVLAVVAGLFTLFGSGLNILPAQKAAQAEKNLKASVAKLGVTGVIGQTCSGSDSDADGYVGCTVNIEGNETKLYECPYGGFGWSNKNCKADTRQQINLGGQ